MAILQGMGGHGVPVCLGRFLLVGCCQKTTSGRRDRNGEENVSHSIVTQGSLAFSLACTSQHLGHRNTGNSISTLVHLHCDWIHCSK